MATVGTLFAYGCSSRQTTVRLAKLTDLTVEAVTERDASGKARVFVQFTNESDSPREVKCELLLLHIGSRKTSQYSIARNLYPHGIDTCVLCGPDEETVVVQELVRFSTGPILRLTRPDSSGELR